MVRTNRIADEKNWFVNICTPDGAASRFHSLPNSTWAMYDVSQYDVSQNIEQHLHSSKTTNSFFIQKSLFNPNNGPESFIITLL